MHLVFGWMTWGAISIWIGVSKYICYWLFTLSKFGLFCNKNKKTKHFPCFRGIIYKPAHVSCLTHTIDLISVYFIKLFIDERCVPSKFRFVNYNLFHLQSSAFYQLMVKSRRLKTEIDYSICFHLQSFVFSFFTSWMSKAKDRNRL